MTHKEFHFKHKKTNFFGQYWKPRHPKSVVVLVHGMGEYSGRYANFFVPTLLKNNIAVISYDNFGHGKTEGKRGHNPNYQSLLSVISKVLNKKQEVYGNIPTYLYGHSMGGNLVLNYALTKQPNVNGIIATSPFLRLAFQPPKWKLIAGKILQKIAPFITLSNELNPKDISRDKLEVHKYEHDQLIHDQVSPNYSITIMRKGKWAIKNAHKLNYPTYILHGSDDRIIDYSASIEFANKTEKATLKIYEGGYHELHNDLCKKEVLQDVINWIDSNI
ncbi:alpha/beta hydrolase [Urechidicola croceus]|uniref:Alpha/beta hydrolase n=1 Tax=Urechidicola croceus TaxID=1850246 RepID=A0A1D8PAJ4_9FLAO|nr:alpha/beta hydrolase [Urechidicola croceus]AOW21566.1 alpha/beta hydrolase [Urechidicola croceus]